VKRIVVAGGIGAGKSAVTGYLVNLGWPVIDADEIAHDVLRPGSLDRAFVAQVVFHDRSALARLNAISHGPIGEEILRRLDEATGPAVFVAIPLFRPEHRQLLSLDEVWAVLLHPETAVTRLCELRGFSLDDATARIANQMTNAERTRIVDRVIWNEGSLSDLFVQVDKALQEIGLARG
jgi:dephospho-CoA kinase